MAVRRQGSLDEIGRRLEVGAKRAVGRAAIIVQREMKRLTGLKSGPTKSNPKAQPSKPYEPPALRTGNLRRSIQIDSSKINRTEGPLVFVGPGAKYARYLEEGTKIMLPRPFVLRTINNTERRVRAEFAGLKLLLRA